MTYRSVQNHTTLEDNTGEVGAAREFYKRSMVVSVTTEENQARSAELETDTDPKAAEYQGKDESGPVNTLLPTNALAGDPGSFEPAGAVLPVDFYDLRRLIPTPSPADDWDTVDQHVVLGDGSFAHWRLGKWNVGKVP